MHIACFFAYFYCYNQVGDYMYYFRKEEHFIVKYSVMIDEEKLKKLRWEIIDKCSLIIHKCYKTTHRPNEFDYAHIRNYKEKLVGVIEYNDFYSMPEDQYLVEYDYYEHSSLVSLIDKLLEGNINVIEENIKIIKKIKKLQELNIQTHIQKEETELLKEQNEIINNLNNAEINDRTKYIELLNQSHKKLNDFQKKKELNKNQIPEIIYCSKVLECITLRKIGIIELTKVLQIQRFFFESTEKNCDIETNKMLKMSK